MNREKHDQRLDILRDKILLLGGATEAAVHKAIESLTTRNSELAQQVLEEDKIVDRMEVEIDEMSIDLLATLQPAEHDLRFVISVAKITPILERIADHAGSIAEAALILNNEPPVKSFVEFPLMAKTATEMLKTALDAFTSEDAIASRAVISRDKEIDECYHRVFGELLGLMAMNPLATTGAAHLLFVAKHLERIGDYVKDICELNVYLREAVFIKHGANV
jgi:phosphate transport system protein